MKSNLDTKYSTVNLSLTNSFTMYRDAFCHCNWEINEDMIMKFINIWLERIKNRYIYYVAIPLMFLKGNEKHWPWIFLGFFIVPSWVLYSYRVATQVEFHCPFKHCRTRFTMRCNRTTEIWRRFGRLRSAVMAKHSNDQTIHHDNKIMSHKRRAGELTSWSEK